MTPPMRAIPGRTGRLYFSAPFAVELGPDAEVLGHAKCVRVLATLPGPVTKSPA